MTVFRNMVDRLPPALRENQLWRELFEAVEETIEAGVGPKIERVMALRSIFTAWPEDLSKRLEELSGYFDDASRRLSKPMSLFWKQVELQNKNSVLSFEAMLQRINIPPAAVEWIPLYCWRDMETHPYGSVFYSRDEMEEQIEIGASRDDFFLSSHVDFRTNLEDVIEYGWDKEQLVLVLERYFEENARPTHIVFGGLTFFLKGEETRGRSLAEGGERGRVLMSRLNTE